MHRQGNKLGNVHELARVSSVYLPLGSLHFLVVVASALQGRERLEEIIRYSCSAPLSALSPGCGTPDVDEFSRITNPLSIG